MAQTNSFQEIALAPSVVVMPIQSNTEASEEEDVPDVIACLSMAAPRGESWYLARAISPSHPSRTLKTWKSAAPTTKPK